MKTRRITNIIGCLVGSLSFLACATTQTARPAEREWQTYVVPSDNPPTNAPPITLRVAAVRLGGKELQVAPDSRRAQEIRASLTNFGEAIARELNHAGSSGFVGQPLQIAIAFDGTEDKHVASAFTKGFVTGLFTFGLLGNVFPGVYTYQSRVSVEVSGKDGKKATYSAQSPEVTVKFDFNDQNAIANASSTARQQADDESLRTIAGQIPYQDFLR